MAVFLPHLIDTALDVKRWWDDRNKPPVRPAATVSMKGSTGATSTQPQLSLMDMYRQMAGEFGIGAGTNPYGADIMSNFNNRAQAVINQLGQTPDFNPLRRYVDDDLTRQQEAAGGGITMAYDQGAQQARDAAVAATAAGNAEAAAQQAMYEQSAGNVQGDMRSAAAAMAGDYGALGPSVGEVSPEAVAIAAELAAQAPRAAAMARNIGNVASTAQNEYASSMQNQKIAELGTLGRTISNLKAQAISQINNQDIAMQQAARQAAMQAALDFQNQQMEMEIAQREWDNQQKSMVNDFVRSGVLSEMERRGGIAGLMGGGTVDSMNAYSDWQDYNNLIKELNAAGRRNEAVVMQQLMTQIAANPNIDYTTALSSLTADQLNLASAIEATNGDRFGFSPDLTWWIREGINRRGTPTANYRLGVGGF